MNLSLNKNQNFKLSLNNLNLIKFNNKKINLENINNINYGTFVEINLSHLNFTWSTIKQILKTSLFALGNQKPFLKGSKREACQHGQKRRAKASRCPSPGPRHAERDQHQVRSREVRCQSAQRQARGGAKQET